MSFIPVGESPLGPSFRHQKFCDGKTSITIDRLSTLKPIAAGQSTIFELRVPACSSHWSDSFLGQTIGLPGDGQTLYLVEQSIRLYSLHVWLYSRRTKSCASSGDWHYEDANPTLHLAVVWPIVTTLGMLRCTDEVATVSGPGSVIQDGDQVIVYLRQDDMKAVTVDSSNLFNCRFGSFRMQAGSSLLLSVQQLAPTQLTMQNLACRIQSMI